MIKNYRVSEMEEVWHIYTVKYRVSCDPPDADGVLFFDVKDRILAPNFAWAESYIRNKLAKLTAENETVDSCRYRLLNVIKVSMSKPILKPL